VGGVDGVVVGGRCKDLSHTSPGGCAEICTGSTQLA
jgi:hypothetical protein